MKLPRRQFLHLAASATALPALSRVAWAQTYPTQPVRLIVGVTAGGSADILARLIGQWLSKRLGQPFVIENRTGAGGNIATEAAVRAPADGYTLLLIGVWNAVDAALYQKLNFNFISDITPVASIALTPAVMVVPPSFPAKTVPEFITYAKLNPDKINYGSAGIGSPNHMAGELFKLMAGINMVHVPYRGAGEALTDTLGGQVQAMFATTGAAIEYIKAGKLRALAVTTATRLDALPDVPTVDEFVRGYDASFWAGIGAPRNTPVEIIDKLNKEINAGLADRKIKERLDDLGNTAIAGSPDDFRKFISDETEKWGKVIRVGNIKPL
jgi:tripartite-type tricarboxylate transporter receptor subunit TctC